MKNNCAPPAVSGIDCYLLRMFRYSVPIGFIFGGAVEAFSEFHFINGFASADCFTSFVLMNWTNEFRYLFIFDAFIILLTSIAHRLLYGEFLCRGSQIFPVDTQKQPFSSLIKRAYLIALIPLLLIAGFFVATILMTEYLNRPGAINRGC